MEPTMVCGRRITRTQPRPGRAPSNSFGRLSPGSQRITGVRLCTIQPRTFTGSTKLTPSTYADYAESKIITGSRNQRWLLQQADVCAEPFATNVARTRCSWAIVIAAIASGQAAVPTHQRLGCREMRRSEEHTSELQS